MLNKKILSNVEEEKEVIESLVNIDCLFKAEINILISLYNDPEAGNAYVRSYNRCIGHIDAMWATRLISDEKNRIAKRYLKRCIGKEI